MNRAKIIETLDVLAEGGELPLPSLYYVVDKTIYILCHLQDSEIDQQNFQNAYNPDKDIVITSDENKVRKLVNPGKVVVMDPETIERVRHIIVKMGHKQDLSIITDDELRVLREFKTILENGQKASN